MKKSKGFTLIELLAVIVIVGILITLVSIGVTKYVKTSKEKVKVQAAEEIIEIAKAYMSTNNVYFVSTKTLVEEGYLESNFTDPNTGKEHQNSDADIFVITCTDDSCSKDNKVTDDGFSTDKFYLSLNSTLNQDLSSVKEGAFDSNNTFSFDKEKLEITIDNNLYSSDDILNKIKKYYEENQNKGVLVMSLYENEKKKLNDKLSDNNIDDSYYLYYDSNNDLKYEKIDEAENKEYMKFLGAKYIIDVIKKINKNSELGDISNNPIFLSNSKLNGLFNFSEIINPKTGSIGIEVNDISSIGICYDPNHEPFKGIGKKNGWYHFNGYQLTI